MDLYLDTSAILKRYKTEDGTDVVDHLYSSKHDLLTSEYSMLEVWAVAARAKKGKVFDQETYAELIGAFADDVRNRLFLWPMEHKTIWAALREIEAYELRAPDSLQLAAAEEVRAYTNDDKQFVFVCSDRELLKGAHLSGMRTLDPAAVDAMEFLKKLEGS